MVRSLVGIHDLEGNFLILTAVLGFCCSNKIHILHRQFRGKCDCCGAYVLLRGKTGSTSATPEELLAAALIGSMQVTKNQLAQEIVYIQDK